MPRHAGNVNDGTGLLHERYDRLHSGDHTEEVRVEEVAVISRIHPGDGVDQAVPRVVDPYVDAPEMMQRQAENAIDFLAVTHVASQGESTLRTRISARAASARPASRDSRNTLAP